MSTIAYGDLQNNRLIKTESTGSKIEKTDNTWQSEYEKFILEQGKGGIGSWAWNNMDHQYKAIKRFLEIFRKAPAENKVDLATAPLHPFDLNKDIDSWRPITYIMTTGYEEALREISPYLKEEDWLRIDSKGRTLMHAIVFGVQNLSPTHAAGKSLECTSALISKCPALKHPMVKKLEDEIKRLKDKKPQTPLEDEKKLEEIQMSPTPLDQLHEFISLTAPTNIQFIQQNSSSGFFSQGWITNQNGINESVSDYEFAIITARKIIDRLCQADLPEAQKKEAEKLLRISEKTKSLIDSSDWKNAYQLFIANQNEKSIHPLEDEMGYINEVAAAFIQIFRKTPTEFRKKLVQDPLFSSWAKFENPIANVDSARPLNYVMFVGNIKWLQEISPYLDDQDWRQLGPYSSTFLHCIVAGVEKMSASIPGNDSLECAKLFITKCPDLVSKRNIGGTTVAQYTKQVISKMKEKMQIATHYPSADTTKTVANLQKAISVLEELVGFFNSF